MFCGIFEAMAVMYNCLILMFQCICGGLLALQRRNIAIIYNCLVLRISVVEVTYHIQFFSIIENKIAPKLVLQTFVHVVRPLDG